MTIAGKFAASLGAVGVGTVLASALALPISEFVGTVMVKAGCAVLVVALMGGALMAAVAIWREE